MMTSAFASVTTGLVIAATVFAATGPVLAKDNACKAEIAKLCPDMKPGDGKYGQCLVDHQNDFSSQCKKYADAAAARKNDLKDLPSCINDAERLCPGTTLGITRLTKCLRAHQGKLSVDCKREVSKRTGKF